LTGEHLAAESEKPATVANITDNDGEHCVTEFALRLPLIPQQIAVGGRSSVVSTTRQHASSKTLTKVVCTTSAKSVMEILGAIQTTIKNNNTNSGYHTNNGNRSDYNNRFNGPRNDRRGNIQDDKTDAMSSLRNQLKNMSDALSRSQGGNSKK
jgi:hypothetical protein